MIASSQGTVRLRLRARKAQLALAVRITVAAVARLAIAQRVASDVAAVGGADVADRDPDERRPIAEGDPRLHVRDDRRRDLWRRHRGADPAFRRGGLLALLVLAVAPLAFIAAINPSLNAATVTAVIVLLVPTMQPRQPARFGDRSRHRGHGRRAHRASGVVSGAAVAGASARSAPARRGCSNCSRPRCRNCWRA